MGSIEPQPFRGRLVKYPGLFRPFRITYAYGEISVTMSQQKMLFGTLGNTLEPRIWEDDVEFIILPLGGTDVVHEAWITQRITFESI
jgi:hypothetical protein